MHNDHVLITHYIIKMLRKVICCGFIKRSTMPINVLDLQQLYAPYNGHSDYAKLLIIKSAHSMKNALLM